MNHYALRLFVRSLIAEAKDKKTKEEPKKDKKETKKPEPKKIKKVSGNLVEMKQDLANLKEKSAKIDDLIGEWEQMKSSAENISYGGEQDIEIGADAKEAIIEDCNKEIEKLKKEKESIDKEIASLKENTSSEINKIKEMMGLTPKTKGKKKMMDEKNKPIQVTPDNEVKADKDLPSTTEAKKMTSAQKDKKEDIVKGMKKSSSFGKSKDEKSKMYATATKLATKKK